MSTRAKREPMKRVRRRLSAGLLVALEGIDGSGKTTQARLLESLLSIEGFDVARFKEPTGGPWGRKIRAIAKAASRDTSRTAIDREVNLFMKDRADDVAKNIRPSLRRKSIVIMDRYYYSSIAYQGALSTLGTEKVRRLNERLCPRPRIVFVLDVPPVIALSRIGRDGANGVRAGSTSFELEENLERVREAFLGMHDPIIHRVDGTAPRGHILEMLFTIVRDIAVSMEKC